MLLSLYVKGKIAAFQLRSAAYRFLSEEKGAADIVAIVLIILAVVALAFVFKDRIISLVNSLFDKVEGANTGDLVTPP